MGERRDADEQHGVDGRAPGDPGQPGESSTLRRSVASILDRVTTDEPWTPPPATERRLAAIRRHLERDERVHVTECVAQTPNTGRIPTGGGGPAAVGVTDHRLLAASDAAVRDIEFERVTSVRATTGTTLGVRLRDARLIAALGYLCSIFAFLAVMVAARDPLTPALTMLAMGGALWYTHVRPHGLVVGGRTVTQRLERLSPFAALSGVLRRVERRLLGRAGTDPITRWSAGALVVAPFVATLRFEGVSVAPVFVTLAVASFAVVGYAVRHSDEFGGLALRRRRYATVDVAVENGSSLSVRTRPDSPLCQALLTRTSGQPVSTDAADG